MADMELKAKEEEPLAADSSTSLEDLTFGIHFYLYKMGQDIIEVGKRLILAKEKLPHGEWQNWLKDNFNLIYRMAARFMEIAERFSKVSTSRHLS
ncbi:MAG: DUF3102 domain-containing protein [Selenomonadaceae bacterium]|nr:DUF3102 domain-containing protein [Selenomonadaceae bacterium]MBQ7630199.1 DUF3102 domain-containing protein [Selenomonadaceae bacterium]